MAHSLPVLPHSLAHDQPTETDPAPRAAPPVPCILDLDAEALARVMAALGQPAYRARQVFQALHQRWAGHWDEMTSLPASLRTRLAARYRLLSGEQVLQAVSSDGTRKRLVRLVDEQDIETVAIPATSPEGARRISVCVSTQAGCAMACTFCATGRMGLARNLTPGEIVDQVYGFGRGDRAARPTHVVFMGMGEPLANYGPTVQAVRLLADPHGANISQRRMTVSTSGLVPQIRRLAGEGLEVTLAISLHAPNDDLRSELMPINRRFPLAVLLAAATEYAERTGRRVSYEYVLLHGVNDLPEHAAQLLGLLPRRLAHVNLIPYNATDAGYQPTPPRQARAFRERLEQGGLSATIRASRGQDIAAACGQLRAENRTRVGSQILRTRYERQYRSVEA
ncbi:MAG: 23S rRNA (adenine(2503)-C(2))-methyltransferase RlmN [Chloroflexi bacterium]|nr:23S rRNA (adenine(2503)-C(2))-methyltransferase RlmN [Chloroflexota bacterium]